MTGTTPTRAVERALALLATVCREDAPSLTECARSTELPPSTVLRLLRTLQQADFVTRGADGLFRAGPHLVQLGARALGQRTVVDASLPSMARIVAQTGESTYLSVLGPGSTALYVAMIEGTHSIRHASWVGRTVPLDGSAAGAVLTGLLPVEGYVTVRSAVEADVTAIAAPVLRPGGAAVVGAISIVGPAYRIDEATTARFGSLLAKEASAVSAALDVGSPHRPSPAGTNNR